MQRPASSGRAPPRLDPQASSSRQMLVSAAQRKQPAGLAPRSSRSGFGCLGGMFVDPYEVAEGHGKISLFGCSKGIEAKRILETCHEDGKAERIETRIQKHGRIGEERQRHILLLGHLLHLRDYGCSYRHVSARLCCPW